MFDFLVVGIAATLTMDIWQRIANALFGIPPSNWAMIGRWASYLPKGQVYHNTIADTPAVPNENTIGWIVHYGVGITYGAIYLFLVYYVLGTGPSLFSALGFSLAAVMVTWFFMEPALGLGMMADKLPKSNEVRAYDLSCHTAFGIGLWLGSLLI